MTLHQGLAFAVIIGMMALFIWGRIRYDLVAMLTLLVAVLVGIVPTEEAFSGFSDDIIVIVASALIISAAVARSGIVELVVRRLGPLLTSPRMIITVLVASVTLLSAFVKNIGALAMLMPVAFQLARRNNVSPSCILMPMAFGSLLGGTMTLIGTSPNVIVSRMREDLVGEPFRMFDFTPVGAVIAAAGVVFLAFGYRLLPGGQKGAASPDAAFNLTGYTTEARIPPDSTLIGQTVAELEALGENEVHVSTIVRERFRRYTPSPNWTLQADDVLLLEGEPAALERIIAQAGLRLAGGEDEALEQDTSSEDIGVVEAVITADSPLVNRTPPQMRLSERHQVGCSPSAAAASGLRIGLRSVKFRAGDVIVLQGHLSHMPDALGELRCLPLAGRDLRLGRDRNRYFPIAILAVAMLLVAFEVLPIAIAFFGASLLMILFRSISLREAYDAIEWPLLILIGALIPVSEAMQSTGATQIIASWLSWAATSLPPLGALALVLIAGMAVTPFLNNAATVLVMAPIAGKFATDLGYNPDPFLMAVALGAASDFLTPIGHQCNTLVMGPGGYRFGDYWRLGLPLSIIVVVVGVPLIALVWPLTPG
jgi:di/tricarboxylate transporter